LVTIFYKTFLIQIWHVLSNWLNFIHYVAQTTFYLFIICLQKCYWWGWDFR